MNRHRMIAAGYAALFVISAGCASTSDLGVGSAGPVEPPPLEARVVAPRDAAGTPVAAAGTAQTPVKEVHKTQPWEFTIGGAGSSDEDFDAGSAAATASIGYFLNEWFELAVRQTGSFADSESTRSVANGSTRLAADFHLPLDMVYPYVGGSIGYVYGDSIEEGFAAGPEAGVKFFLKSSKDVFLNASAEWLFFFDENDSLNSAFDDGVVSYGLGLGMRF
jgi:hypothetical protein